MIPLRSHSRARARSCAGRRLGLALAAACALAALAAPALVSAESPAPSVHWGGLAYPDQSNLLTLGFTGNRFTEFDGEGQRFNDIRETMGFNFASISWTQHWRTRARFERWSTNLTVGAGPTSDQPTRYLQNEFIHDAVWGIPKVPVGRIRGGADFMIDGSATWWAPLAREDLRRHLYVGGGFSSGSLYHELFVRAGARRLPIGDLLAAGGQELVRLVTFGARPGWIHVDWLKGFRLSVMGRYSRSYSGAAFHDVAPQTWFGQTSVSWGIYDEKTTPSGRPSRSRYMEPFVELELGAAVDSGLFTSLKGDALEVRFWTAKMQIRRFVFETWNDQLNRQDFGPTYGFRLTYDVYGDLYAWLVD